MTTEKATTDSRENSSPRVKWARNGFEVARQFVLAKFDIAIHSLRFTPPNEKSDLLAIWMEIESSLGIGGSMPCAALWMFPHLAGEYAGYYYGYAFSESIVPKIEWNDPIVAMKAVLASI